MSDGYPPLPDRVETLISGADRPQLQQMARFAARSSLLYSQAGAILCNRVELILDHLRAGRISEATAEAADIVETRHAAPASSFEEAAGLHPVGHA